VTSFTAVPASNIRKADSPRAPDRGPSATCRLLSDRTFYAAPIALRERVYALLGRSRQRSSVNDLNRPMPSRRAGASARVQRELGEHAILSYHRVHSARRSRSKTGSSRRRVVFDADQRLGCSTPRNARPRRSRAKHRSSGPLDHRLDVHCRTAACHSSVHHGGSLESARAAIPLSAPSSTRRSGSTTRKNRRSAAHDCDDSCDPPRDRRPLGGSLAGVVRDLSDNPSRSPLYHASPGPDDVVVNRQRVRASTVRLSLAH